MTSLGWLGRKTSTQTNKTILWVYSADDKLVIFFRIVSQIIVFDISCKLFSMETICMNIKVYFLRKIREKIKLSSAGILPSVLSVSELFLLQCYSDLIVLEKFIISHWPISFIYKWLVLLFVQISSQSNAFMRMLKWIWLYITEWFDKPKNVLEKKK